MRKRGAMLSQTISIIIATLIVIGILFLFGPLAFGLIISTEERNAQNIRDSVVGKIDALENGQENDFIINGVNSDGIVWYLVGWSDGESGRPEKCSLNSCICVCPGEDIKLAFRAYNEEKELQCHLIGLLKKSEFGEACQEEGFCKKLEQSEIDVRTEWVLLLKSSSGDEASLRTRPYISLENPVNSFEISKESEKLTMIHRTGASCQERLEIFESGP